MAINSYVGAAGIVNAVSPTHLEIVDDLANSLILSMNEVLNNRANNVDNDLRELMIGSWNNGKMTVSDILLGHEFLAPDPYLQTRLREKEEHRGYDSAKDSHAKATGPTGFLRFANDNIEMHDITKEDTVRSSLFVHRHKFDQGMDIPTIGEALKREGLHIPEIAGVNRALPIDQRNITRARIARSEPEGYWKDGVFWPPKQSTKPDRPAVKVAEAKPAPEIEHLGRVPGAYTIPICRNPAGESISSVWAKEARDYPCMCGPFTWKSGWSIGKDETKGFFNFTGLIYSEDWEEFCHGHNKCKGEDSIDWH
ncbi:hypothetical protein EK21DRAFT_116613 [Setomelanomma holmii]|uniref:Uncharacterized protein n=1 Tax=Setomelanomma holmii TaxID=210430 RepID=A0A9P4H0X7_9PLEO|nr:hypothetical protein EK21DRAFT_116613 [Setomelanomma holmii]